MIDEQSSASEHDYASDHSAIRAGKRIVVSMNIDIINNTTKIPELMMAG